MVELATGIWMMKMTLPILVEERLKAANQHQVLLELYLSDSRLDLDKAVELAQNDPHGLTRALMDTDMQLLAFFLETLDQSIIDNSEQLAAIDANKAERLRYLDLRRE